MPLPWIPIPKTPENPRYNDASLYIEDLDVDQPPEHLPPTPEPVPLTAPRGYENVYENGFENVYTTVL